MSSATRNGQVAWVVSPYPWRRSQQLADSLGIPLPAAMVLAGRGITDPREARAFLDCAAPLPDPFLFAHMQGVVEALSAAIDENRRIVIHGDYDADGITATALMLLALRDFGVEAEWYLPSRFNEGYGLSRTAVQSIASAGRALLITVDCGVNYPGEVDLAKSLGLDVVVIDHHRPGPVLPDCQVIHEVVGEYPHGDLCGVGLALKVMHALHVHRHCAEVASLPEQLHALLDLVAIGTIADLAPLKGENRYYVKEGLKLVGIGQRVGIRALSSVAACVGVADSSTVAYRLAPRLNAAGRLADPSPPLRLLLTDDEEEAHSLAVKLHELNGARQDVERQILDDAVAGVEALGELPPAIVLAGDTWHEGVVGIVASRLVERYQRPAILLGVREGVAKGSGRSIAAYDLMAGLNAGAQFLTVYGGHRQAVGLTLDIARLDDFRRCIQQHAACALQPQDLAPTYQADAVLRGEEVNADTALALGALGPFGTGNPRPRVLLVDASLHNAETTRNGAHLRCTVDVDGIRVRAIGFGLGAANEALGGEATGRVLGGQFRVDEWQGNLRPEFLLERIGPPQDDGATDPDTGCPPAAGAEPCVSPGLCLDCPYVVTARSGRVAPTPPAGAPARMLRMPPAHDLRDRKSRMSGVAQVLGSGERAAILACSIAHTVPWITGLPVPAGGVSRPACLGRACARGPHMRLTSARAVVMEWDVAGEGLPTLGWPEHVIAVDPPFRPSHVAALERAAEAGATIHLCYGKSERQATARLLRYLIHPRFAMVCAYRAMQDREHNQEKAVPGSGTSTTAEEAILSRAAATAWREGGVVLTSDDLMKALRILEELGVGRLSQLEAKLETRRVAAYVAAEAEFEECSRLCQTL